MAKNRNVLNCLTNEAHDCNIIVDTREIFLHRHKDDDYDVDTFSANILIKNLRILESQNTKSILIHQFSNGGASDSGMAMYDAIKHCLSPVIIMMWGTACSCGSIVPQAADLRIIAPNAIFMVHYGYISLDSTFRQSKEWMKYAEIDNDNMLDLYASKCVNGKFFVDKQMDQDEVKRFLKKKLETKEDWIMSALDAVKYGFADAVYGQPGYEDIGVIRQIYDK